VTSLRSLVPWRPRTAVTGVAITAMALAGCAIGPGTSGQAASGKSPSPSAAAGAAADRKLAAKVNLTLADLSTGFAKVDESFGTAAQLSANPDCIKAPATLFAATARHSRDFSYHLDAKQREAGHVTSLVTVGASAGENAGNFAVISSDAYVSCVSISLNDFIAAATAQPAGTVSVTRSTAYPALAAPSVVYEAQVPFSYNGTRQIEYETDLHVSSGRLTAHLIADRCCADSADPTWTKLIQRLSTQLAKAVKQ
jgi:hypothetical protein